jgi:maltooligosyltrehalose trehalohydrolase
MIRMRVWAPNASRVELALGPDLRERLEMAPEPDAAHGASGGAACRSPGWWSVEAPVTPETDYALVLDGGTPLPDPRAARLPAGVHGPSRIVDHAAFGWTDAGFVAPPLAEAIFYELHVGTFSPEGTFDGVRERLDYLVDLGVTHVELMPVHSFPGRFGWGYDSVGLYAPQEGYGGPDGLKRLVDAAHARGLAVALDVVYNHFGPEGNYLDHFGPYRTDRFRTPWGPAVNLGDAGSDEVRCFLIENALSWLRDYHVDVLRLDAVHAFMDLTATHFLEELGAEVRELGLNLGRNLALVAESDLNDPRLLRCREDGGYQLDAQWSDDFHHALHVVLTGERDGYYSDFRGLADVAEALERTWIYRGRYSAFRGRRHGRAGDDLEQNRFLGYLQNHDQVGNRAAGERIGELAGARRQRIGAAIVLTSPFIPLIFAGEEWGASTPFPFFADYGAEELRQAVREGRRKEFEAFGWDASRVPDPTAESTFQSAGLRWSELSEPEHARTLDWYRRLIALRKERPDLHDGGSPEADAESDQLLVVHRPGLDVLVNLGSSPASFDLDRSPDRILGSEPDVRLKGDELLLPPESAAIAVFPAGDGD